VLYRTNSRSGVDFSLCETCTLIFLFVKLILFVELVACWFFVRETFCVLTFSSWNLYIDFSPPETYFVHKTCCEPIFIHETCCRLIFVRETYCMLIYIREMCSILIFLPVKLIMLMELLEWWFFVYGACSVLIFLFVRLEHWFFLISKLILFMGLVALWLLFGELIVRWFFFVRETCRILISLFVKFVHSFFCSWNWFC